MLFLIAAGCSGADSGPVFTADEVRSPTPTPTTQLVVPLTTVPLTDVPLTEPPAEPVSATVVFDLLSSPEDGVAEIVGRGAASTDLVTVAGVNAAFLTFESTADGGFVATVSIIGERQHTVCIAETCGVLDLPG
jgi:hypothetical protein